MKRVFVRLVSHEIRTPLNVVMAGLKLIDRELSTQSINSNISETTNHSSILDTLGDIKLSCDAAVDLLDDLLAYEKLDAGIMVLEKTPVNVAAFVWRAIQPFYIQVEVVLQCIMLYKIVLYVNNSCIDDVIWHCHI